MCVASPRATLKRRTKAARSDGTAKKKRCIATIAETQDRTGDLEIFSLTLSQLSYRGFRNNCPLQNMKRARAHSWRVDGGVGAEGGRHYTSEVAQWLACWAHNPKVPGSKPGFATQNLNTPGLKQARRNRRGEQNDQAIVSQTGVWTGLQPQGCGDTERFNSSSVATPPAARRNCFFAHAGNRTQGTSMGGLYVATTLHALTHPERAGRARAFFATAGGAQGNATLTLHKGSRRTQMTLWPSG